MKKNDNLPENEGIQKVEKIEEKGLSTYDDSVTFINENNLQPDVKPIHGTAKTMADQAAAMMIQDARSFMQGSEQVYMMATAKALAMALSQSSKDQKTAKQALKQIFRCQGKIVEFSTGVGSLACNISKNFDEKSTLDDSPFPPWNLIDQPVNEQPNQ